MQHLCIDDDRVVALAFLHKCNNKDCIIGSRSFCHLLFWFRCTKGPRFGCDFDEFNIFKWTNNICVLRNNYRKHLKTLLHWWLLNLMITEEWICRQLKALGKLKFRSKLRLHILSSLCSQWLRWLQDRGCLGTSGCDQASGRRDNC
jgi:hypothetical protein